jgi:polysaccharide biosynthesis/export protein
MLSISYFSGAKLQLADSNRGIKVIQFPPTGLQVIWRHLFQEPLVIEKHNLNRKLINLLSIRYKDMSILRCSFFSLLIFPLIFCSCATTKRTRYFQNLADTGKLETIARSEYKEPIIQVDDILTVTIQTIDPQASALANSGNLPASQGNSSASTPLSSPISPSGLSGAGAVVSPGYLVDRAGTITLPVLGKQKVIGLSTSQARDVIQALADSFFKDPSVSVRFANFKISVAGEVQRPGSYIMPNEKITVLDAITMAGDLTIFGRRDNVLVIRENPDGTHTPFRINLKSTDFMSSPFFYLKQNDYIYVEPDKGKSASLDAAQARNYAIAASVLTVLIVLISRINN